MIAFAGTAAAAIAAALVAQAAPPAISDVDGFGHAELLQGRDGAAIEAIMADPQADQDDPARLINLAIAHARRGDAERARTMFEAALASRDRVELETADGRWVDSRRLARQGLAILERGGFAATASSIAAR